MADLQNYSLTPNGTISASMTRFDLAVTYKKRDGTLASLNVVIPSAAFFGRFTAQELESYQRNMYEQMIRDLTEK